MTVVTLEEQDTRIVVSFPYDADAVATLKDAVPSYARSYDPSTKHWFVDKGYGNELSEAMIARGHSIADTEPEPEPTVDEFFDNGYDAKAKAAEILAGIPPDFHGKVFRAMAHRLYPDMYGKLL